MTDLLKPVRSRTQDWLRAIGYLNLAAWSALFFIFPPNAFLSEVAEVSRLFWLSVAFIGAVMAIAGAVTGVDIKLEFPGLLLAFVGPFFYCISQLYMVLAPPVGLEPTQRIALVAYALLPVTLLLPRAFSLMGEKNRLKGRVK